MKSSKLMATMSLRDNNIFWTMIRRDEDMSYVQERFFNGIHWVLSGSCPWLLRRFALQEYFHDFHQLSLKTRLTCLFCNPQGLICAASLLWYSNDFSRFGSLFVQPLHGPINFPQGICILCSWERFDWTTEIHFEVIHYKYCCPGGGGESAAP